MTARDRQANRQRYWLSAAYLLLLAHVASSPSLPEAALPDHPELLGFYVAKVCTMVGIGVLGLGVAYARVIWTVSERVLNYAFSVGCALGFTGIHYAHGIVPPAPILLWGSLAGGIAALVASLVMAKGVGPEPGETEQSAEAIGYPYWGAARLLLFTHVASLPDVPEAALHDSARFLCLYVVKIVFMFLIAAMVLNGALGRNERTRRQQIRSYVVTMAAVLFWDGFRWDTAASATLLSWALLVSSLGGFGAGVAMIKRPSRELAVDS